VLDQRPTPAYFVDLTLAHPVAGPGPQPSVHEILKRVHDLARGTFRVGAFLTPELTPEDRRGLVAGQETAKGFSLVHTCTVSRAAGTEARPTRHFRSSTERSARARKAPGWRPKSTVRAAVVATTKPMVGSGFSSASPGSRMYIVTTTRR
jgi:hypothetical protein